MIKQLLAILFVAAVLVGISDARAASVSYDPPTQREDNTPLLPSEIAGYNVYNESGTVVKQLPGTATSFTMALTSVAQSLFITTVDTQGRESVYSQPAIIPALTTSPKPPGNIKITIEISG